MDSNYVRATLRCVAVMLLRTGAQPLRPPLLRDGELKTCVNTHTSVNACDSASLAVHNSSSRHAATAGRGPANGRDVGSARGGKQWRIMRRLRPCGKQRV